jgi:hypothetical protein
MPFKDLPEGQTHSFLESDWVSDCCGSRIVNFPPDNYTHLSHIGCCEHCGKPCNPKQLHDIKIEKV